MLIVHSVHHEKICASSNSGKTDFRNVFGTLLPLKVLLAILDTVLNNVGPEPLYLPLESHRSTARAYIVGWLVFC